MATQKHTVHNFWTLDTCWKRKIVNYQTDRVLLIFLYIAFSLFRITMNDMHSGNYVYWIFRIEIGLKF